MNSGIPAPLKGRVTKSKGKAFYVKWPRHSGGKISSVFNAVKHVNPINSQLSDYFGFFLGFLAFWANGNPTRVSAYNGMKTVFMRNWASVQSPILSRYQVGLVVDAIREREGVRRIDGHGLFRFAVF